jgi:hypothetical protein
MNARIWVSAAITAALSTYLACGPARTPRETSGTDGGATSCQGAGCPGHPPPPTVNPDGGTQTFSSLSELRTKAQTGQHVHVENVVVHAVSNTYAGSFGSCAGLQYAEFWVRDNGGTGKEGIWLYKHCSDLPTTYSPSPGDVLTVDGWFGFTKQFDDRDGYRKVIKGQFDFGGQGKLTLTKTGTVAAPLPLTVDADTLKFKSSVAGNRVHFPGPLTLTAHSPKAFEAWSYGELKGFNGFEVTGGILVNNYKTYFRKDAGVDCDWRRKALDGGTVTFPDGLTGVWDTYTHAPCISGDGGSDCFRAKGTVPGQDAGYVYVVYPQGCEDLPATVN